MLTEIDDPEAALLAARYGAVPPDVRLRWNSVIEPLLSHRSVRAYRPDPLPEGTLETAIIEGQTAKAAQSGSTLDPSGYDAGKKVVGRTRHRLTDTIGMLRGVIVHPADMQDRDGAEPLLRQARRLLPFIERLIGDAG